MKRKVLGWVRRALAWCSDGAGNPKLPLSDTLYDRVTEAVRSDGLRFYGDGGTIHSSVELDVETRDGMVLAVWYRCQPLAFRQVEVGYSRATELTEVIQSYGAPMLRGVVLEDRPVERRTMGDVDPAEC